MNNITISLVDPNGTILYTEFGPTNAELLTAHNNHTCTFLCPHCYQEACNYKEKNP